MALIQRRIDIAIRLAAGPGTNQPAQFANTTSDTITLTNHRTSVRVQNSGGLAGSSANISVWGMRPSLMNELSTLGLVVAQVPNNILTVTAGDERSGMSTVFTGTIMQAYADYNSAPDVPFKFECLAGAAENAIPFPASSFPGATKVADILSAIAQRAGWGFENSGVPPVQTVLQRPYYAGTSLNQVQRICAAARINFQLMAGVNRSVDQPGNILAIWPLYGSRSTPAGIPLIGPRGITGAGQMIGYPSYTQQGIVVRTLFDPRLIMGGQFKLISSLPSETRAGIGNKSGIWNILKLDLALEALKPKGAWESICQGYNPQFPRVIPQETGS